jgi:hypothetical protein
VSNEVGTCGHLSGQAGARHSQSPMKAMNGTVMRITWHPRLPTHRSILLIAEKTLHCTRRMFLFTERAGLETLSIIKWKLRREAHQIAEFASVAGDEDGVCGSTHRDRLSDRVS